MFSQLGDDFRTNIFLLLLLTADRCKVFPCSSPFTSPTIELERVAAVVNARYKMEQSDSTHSTTVTGAQQQDTPARPSHDDARGNAHTQSLCGNGSNRGHSQQPPHKRKSEQELSRRSKKNFSRKWNGPTRRERNVDSRPDPEDKEERRPKKKVACFIGYSGEGYHGMQ